MIVVESIVADVSDAAVAIMDTAILGGVAGVRGVNRSAIGGDLGPVARVACRHVLVGHCPPFRTLQRAAATCRIVAGVNVVHRATLTRRRDAGP